MNSFNLGIVKQKSSERKSRPEKSQIYTHMTSIRHNIKENDGLNRLLGVKSLRLAISQGFCVEMFEKVGCRTGKCFVFNIDVPS